MKTLKSNLETKFPKMIHNPAIMPLRAKQHRGTPKHSKKDSKLVRSNQINSQGTKELF